MNKRKIENWLIFCLKMLPFIFLIFFTLYFFRHELPSSVVTTIDTYDFLNYEIGDTFDVGDKITFDNISNLELTSYSYDFELFPNPVDGVMPYNRLVYTVLWYQPSYTLHISLSIDGVSYGSISSNDEFVFDAPLKNGFENVDVIVNSSFTLYNIRFGSISDEYSEFGFFGYFSNVVEYTEPLTISSYYFSEYLDKFFSINLFNLNDFKDWISVNWFGNNPPLVFNIVFKILIYELFIDLIYLLYSFMTFIVKFAQKWLNGIYNKDW